MIDKAIHTLLANLIGDRNRLTEMGYKLQPEHLPESMKLERVTLQALYHCATRQYPPTADNLIQVLEAQYNVPEPKAIDWIGTLEQRKTEDRNVRVLSQLVREQLVYRTNRDAIAKALDEYEHGIGDATSRLNRAKSIISTASRSHDEAYIIRRDSEIVDFHEGLQRIRAKNLREGAPPGPSLKFAGFVGKQSPSPNEPPKIGKIPHLNQGDTILVTGASGSGKTTLGSIWAEHNAWIMGYDVLYLHNETDQATIFDRMYSRGTLIRTDYLSSGMLDPDDMSSKLTRDYLAYGDYMRKPVKHGVACGYIAYCYCPAWTLPRIEDEITFARQVSQERGRGLLVILDYYNIINRDGLPAGNKAEQLGHIAIKLRDRVKVENTILKHTSEEKNGVTMIMFAQETALSDGSTIPYGSREAFFYSQVMISIRREKATSDMPLTPEQHDAHGNKRYYHRRGEMAGATTLMIEKANQGSTGPVEVYFENAMSIVVSA